MKEKVKEASDKNKTPYTEAVSTGQYKKKTGLSGKYDNVRRFWEDEVTRMFLRSYLKDIVDEKSHMLERLRILDIGCGSGDGFDLLMGITSKDVGIYEYAVDLINPEQLGYYKGIDINPSLIEQARSHYSYNDKVVFECGDCFDLTFKDDKPFDIYFTAYGTISHFKAEQTAKLLANIARNSRNRAIIILDWLGKYSYEWQDLWSNDTDEQFMDYRISYIYNPEERHTANIQSFPLRLTCREDIYSIVSAAARVSGVDIDIRKIFDRSIFVGRHMDTGEYNRHCTPMREAVNSLLEPNIRTDMNTLIMDYVPREGFNALNGFFDKFSACWNALVRRTISFLSSYGGENGSRVDVSEDYEFYPVPLKQAIHTMEKVIRSTVDLPGDSRANIIEPQLAYALRKLEMELQTGEGVGHGLVGIFEIRK